MWTNKVTSIRQLSRDFYNGDISPEEYRRQRTLQLELISAGENPYGDDEKTRPRDTVAAATDDVKEPVKPSVQDKVSNIFNNMGWIDRVPNGRIVVPAVAVVFILIILIWLLWPASAPQKPMVKPVPVSATKAPVVEINPARKPVENFVDKDDWGIGSIADFAKVWDGLTDEQRQQARNASWFRPLKDGLRSRILEQQALQDNDIDDSIKIQSEQEILLESFAGHLGINK